MIFDIFSNIKKVLLIDLIKKVLLSYLLKFQRAKASRNFRYIFILYWSQQSLIQQLMQKHRESLIQMDFIQKVTLSPFEKYMRFGRFPWKFILHLMLIALCTYQALKIVSIQDKHTRIQQAVFSNIYLQNDDGSSSYPYYSLSQFSDAFFSIVENTQSLDENLLQYSEIDDVEYSLQIYYSEIDNDKQNKMIIKGDSTNFLDNLNKQLGISASDLADFKVFLQSVENMDLSIEGLRTFISKNQKNQLRGCLQWSINVGYSLQSLANVEGTLQAESKICQSSKQQAINKDETLIGIHIAVMVVASFSLVLSWRQVYFVSKEYLYFKRKAGAGESQFQKIGDSRFKKHTQWEKNWEDLGFIEKLKFFDFWFIIIVAGNFFQIFGAVVSILSQNIEERFAIFEHKQLLVGFGVMLAWITILKYLEYSPNLNLMSATLAKSWSNLFVFLLGVMPFFLGFVFLGQTIFWKYNKFQDTSSSVITLFSLLNGDIVNDTFLQTWAEGLPGQLYLFIFMILFYTAVQNVFVTIIMEGYEDSIKEREHKKMIQDKEAQDRQQFENSLEKIEQLNQDFPQSPQLTPEQQSSVTKLRKNGKKVQLILQELDRIYSQIGSTDLTPNQKQYLNTLLKDNLNAIATNIKLQLNDINK